MQLGYMVTAYLAQKDWVLFLKEAWETFYEPNAVHIDRLSRVNANGIAMEAEEWQKRMRRAHEAQEAALASKRASPRLEVREWLFRALREELGGEDGVRTVCLYTAAPGFGKSAFAAEAVDRGTNKNRLRLKVAAYHFCRFDSPASDCTAGAFVLSLASQMALHCPEYLGLLKRRQDLQALFEDDRLQGGAWQSLRDGIWEPLIKLELSNDATDRSNSSRGPGAAKKKGIKKRKALLLVDGLDEANPDILALLSRSGVYLERLGWLQLVCTSRERGDCCRGRAPTCASWTPGPPGRPGSVKAAATSRSTSTSASAPPRRSRTRSVRLQSSRGPPPRQSSKSLWTRRLGCSSGHRPCWRTSSCWAPA